MTDESNQVSKIIVQFVRPNRILRSGILFDVRCPLEYATRTGPTTTTTNCITNRVFSTLHGRPPGERRVLCCRVVFFFFRDAGRGSPYDTRGVHGPRHRYKSVYPSDWPVSRGRSRPVVVSRERARVPSFNRTDSVGLSENGGGGGRDCHGQDETTDHGRC